MLKERARAIRAFVVTLDALVVAVAFVLAHWARSSVLPGLGIVSGELYPLERYIPLLPLALLIWVVLLLRSGVYRSHRLIALSAEVVDLAKVSALAGVFFALSIFLFRLDETLLGEDRISRTWFVLLAVFSFCGLVAEKVMIRLTARYFRSRGFNYRNLLIVGMSDSARAIADSVDRNRYWGFKIAGFLTDSAEDEQVGDHPVLGRVEELGDLVENLAIDEVIFALRHPDPERDGRLLNSLQELGINARFAVSPFPEAVNRPQVGELDGVPLLTYSRIPRAQLPLLAKRLLDIVVSVVTLTLLSPLLLAIAGAIKLTSGGGVLFAQTRCGLNGRRFRLLKFRTMVADAEASRQRLAHLNEMEGPVFKIRRDPRVTRVGAILRRFSLDELPQLLNVLKGEMSLVGPRPAIPEEVDQYQRWQRRRLSMRPGLTCLWQIGGRNQIDFERWMELDLEYIDNWSPLLDAKILAKTIPAVLSGRGAS